MTGPQQQRETVILFDQGTRLADKLKNFLTDKTVVTVPNLKQVMEQQQATRANTLLCSLLLSHRADAADCAAVIAELAGRFRNILFCEPSAYAATYLNQLGLKSFHTGFTVNRFLSSLTTDFFLDHTAAYAITLLGCNAALDSSVPWIVPIGFPPNEFPTAAITKDAVRFAFPVFEYSCFLYAAYDAPALSLEDDLSFVERKIRKTPMHLAGIGATPWILLKDAGETLYLTAGDPEHAGDARSFDNRDPQDFHRRAQIAKSDAAEFPVEAAWRKSVVPQVMDMRVGCVDDCIVLGTGGVIVDRKLLAESTHLLAIMHPPNPVLKGMRRPHAVGHVAGLAVIAMNAVSFNYYHWLSQVMPFLDVAKKLIARRGERTITLVTGRSFAFQDPFVAALFSDFDEVRVIRLKVDEYVTVDQALHSSVLGDEGPQRVVLEQAAMAHRMKQLFIPQSAPASRLLYISRADSKLRTITNEDELSRRLQSIGFEILTLTGLPIRDQIIAFSQAKMVLGAHGAGLTNILFASPHAHLVELQQSVLSNTCMLRLAQAVGARHTVTFVHPTASDPSARAGWRVDVDDIARMADRILAEDRAVPPPA